MIQPQIAERYSFGNFILLTGPRELLCDGGSVPLTPKEFQTLLLLVEAQGRALAREYMIQVIWPDTVVGETSLGRNISVLRRHVGADAIVSVARFGYRFTPKVSCETEAPAQNAAFASTPAPLPASRARPLRFGRPVNLRAAVAALTATLAGLGLIAFLFHAIRQPAAASPLSPEAAYWDQFGVTALHEGTYLKASKAFERTHQLAPQAAIVHLQLAEAWFQMDFVEAAQKEVLLAESLPGHNQLSALDRLRAEALRAMIVQDYALAIKNYEDAVSHASGADRVLSLEDLGIANQREGRLEKAAESFAEASRLGPTDPGPELDLGKLDSLQRRWTGAKQHFDRATRLFEAGSNLEGRAEVYYQLSVIAYVQAQYQDEKALLEQALAVANSLADQNMQLRCIHALSTMYRWNGQLDLSQRYAIEETKTAAASGSLYFYASGMMAQANVAVARHDRAASERFLQQAAALATRTGNARQQANAEFTFAQFSGDTGEYAQEILYADRAIAHYRSYGSVDGVADAFLLRIQGEAHSGDLTKALTDAQQLLSSSQQTHSDLFMEDAEQELGEIYSARKQEPEALVHFLRAEDWSHRTGSEPVLKALHVAGSYARLGQWQKAKAIWTKIPSSSRNDPDCAAAYAEVQSLLKGR